MSWLFALKGAGALPGEATEPRKSGGSGLENGVGPRALRCSVGRIARKIRAVAQKPRPWVAAAAARLLSVAGVAQLHGVSAARPLALGARASPGPRPGALFYPASPLKPAWRTPRKPKVSYPGYAARPGTPAVVPIRVRNWPAGHTPVPAANLTRTLYCGPGSAPGQLRPGQSVIFSRKRRSIGAEIPGSTRLPELPGHLFGQN